MESKNKNIVSMPLANLTEDLSIYPRHAVDEAHVARLQRSIEAGDSLPPPIIDKKSTRIVDGWHRVRAYKRVLGPSGVINVELHEYEDERSLILDAISLNMGHGRPLDKQDEIRCIHLAQNAGADILHIAVVLRRSVPEVAKMEIRIAYSPADSTITIPGTSEIVLKRPVQHMAGANLTKQQAEAQQSVPGTSYLLLTHQLYDAVHLGMANREDEKLMKALRQLKDELIIYFNK